MFKFSSRKLVALMLVLVFMFSLVGCGKTGDNGNDGTEQPEAPAEPIKIGFIGSKTGALSAYHQQSARGLELGLDYVTNGTGKIAGREVIIIEEDDEGKPDVAKDKVVKLLEEDKVDFIIGCESSTSAIAIAPLAEEYETIFVIDPAVADALVADSWNRFLFKTGRSSGQDAAASAAAIAKPGVKIATLAQDVAFGRDGVAAFKREAEKLGAEIVAEEYSPMTATDWTANIQKIIAADPDYLWVVWAGGVTPWKQIADLQVAEKHGIKLSTGAPDQAALAFMTDAIGMQGMCVYHPNLPQSAEAKKIHDWFLDEHKKRFNGDLPDLFTPAGFNMISAIATAVEEAGGVTDAETLIPIMEGMKFPTPKGTFEFRKEDHLALQPLYVIELVMGEKIPEPKLIRELSPSETEPSILNGK